MKAHRIRNRLSALVALMFFVSPDTALSDESWVETAEFRDGYARLIDSLERRSPDLRRQKLREEIEYLFLGGQLQPTNLSGPVERFERVGLAAIRSSCCPGVRQCLMPLEHAANRRRLGLAMATAASETGANDDPFTLGRATAAFARLLEAAPEQCVCRSDAGIDRILLCSGGG